MADAEDEGLGGEGGADFHLAFAKIIEGLGEVEGPRW